MREFTEEEKQELKEKIQEPGSHGTDETLDNENLQQVHENQIEHKKAGFWIRFGAVFVDLMLFSVVSNIIQTKVLTVILYCSFFITYPIFSIGRYGQTLGKRVFGLRVLRTDSSRVSYGRAFLRWIGYLCSTLILGFGYLMIGWTKRKQGLHDKLAKTSVFIDPEDPLKEVPIILRILGVLSILGGLQGVLILVRPFPAILFGLMLTGVGAKLVSMIVGLIGIYVGWGFLKLWKATWTIAIVYYSYIIVNSLLGIRLIPRMTLIIQQMMVRQDLQTGAWTGMLMGVLFLTGVIFSTLILVYLITKRKLFVNPTSISKGAVLCLVVFLVCAGIAGWSREEPSNRMVSEKLITQFDHIFSWIPGSPRVSPDSKRIAYVVKESKKLLVLVDGEEGKKHDGIGGFIFSPDGKRVVADLRDETKDSGMGTGLPVFSPDSR